MPIHCEIRVKGRVSETLADSLGLCPDVHPVETTLHGEVRDRVELHALLDRLDALGLDVVELRRTRAAQRLPHDESPFAGDPRSPG
jgi:hypothetical protein